MVLLFPTPNKNLIKMESELNLLLDYPNYTASLMEEHEYVMM